MYLVLDFTAMHMLGMTTILIPDTWTNSDETNSSVSGIISVAKHVGACDEGISYD
jgi:hypothetical protein